MTEEPSAETRIRGFVAAVLNRRELVLNVGSDHGVEIGMKFAVLNRQGLSITDPETGEMLDSVEIPKVLVQVARTQPRVAVARTFVRRSRNVGGSGPSIASLFEPRRMVTEYETLRSADKPYEEELDETESYVKAGDPVVQVIGDEFISTSGSET